MRSLRLPLLLTVMLVASFAAVAQTVTFNCSSNCGVIIPDGYGSLVSTIDIPASYSAATVGSLAIGLSIVHESVGDLHISMVHTDSGRSARLVLPSDCPWDDVGPVVFSSAPGPAQPCEFLIPAVSGNVRAPDTLAVFNGDLLPGTWVLTVRDEEATGYGLLKNWSLIVTPAQPFGASISPSKSSKSALAGLTVTHTFTVKNRGSFPDSFTLTLNGGSFPPSFTTPGPISNLAPGATATVTVKVDIPSPIAAGTKSTSTLRATSVSDPTKYATATLITTVAKPRR